jgi:DNA repair protein RecN (Recombination protein N)
VTHLPQIARLADQHLRVVKESSARKTAVRAVALSPADRVAEMTRLLGAAEEDDVARQHATEMLDSAEAERASLRSNRQTASERAG